MNIFSKYRVAIYLLLMLAGAQALNAQKKTGAPPNIIVIFADDLGYGDLSCYGHPTIRTPHIDSMAAQGMRFTQFYVGANVCTPSRAALLTGRLPVRYGIAGGGARDVFFPNSANGLPASEITIAQELKKKNYRTGIIGKWHLGILPQYLPTHHGFDYYYGLPFSNDMIPEDGGWQPLIMFRNDSVVEQNPDQTQLQKKYTKEAVDFIKRNKDHPFFLYYASNAPHEPLYASGDFNGKSRRGIYGDVVEELDWSVGQVLNTLKQENLDKNTIVIFTSDNGPWLLLKKYGGSAGLLFEGKGSTYEGGMREPAIAWWPGTIQPNQVNEAIASTLDFFPTFLHLAGIEMPKDKPYDGTDMTPLLLGTEKAVRDLFFYYNWNNLYAVRKGKWKAHFITKPSYRKDVPPTYHDIPQLYNIEEDPSEKYDVSEKFPAIVDDLRKEYEKEKASVNKAPSILDSTYWDRLHPPKEWWKPQPQDK